MTPNVNFVSNLQAGNFVFDGAYVQGVLSQQALPTGPATNFTAIVGAGSWGIPNRVLTASGPQGALLAVGRKTSVKASAYSAAIDASPECNQFKFVRVTDGTDVAAKINLVDTATPTPANVLILTAACTGSDGNLGSARIDLASGTATASPVYNITIYDPFGGTTVYKNIPGFSTAGGPYVATAFQANALAAINGTAPNSTANPYYIATAGTSTIAPVTGQASLAMGSGGTDGDSGVTDTMLIGTDAQAASTGMYVLRGSIAGGQLVLA
ncbi:MAG TPA: hypothetical protein VFN49_03745, partial [Candidatus Aquilonibacter sp.]|nr:hypothetical protein [Candidatus Aquilonibacter sp.]